ncbi:MAG: hypothetical protein AAF533_13440 [Acidobacteriota bacterium]
MRPVTPTLVVLLSAVLVAPALAQPLYGESTIKGDDYQWSPQLVSQRGDVLTFLQGTSDSVVLFDLHLEGRIVWARTLRAGPGTRLLGRSALRSRSGELFVAWGVDRTDAGAWLARYDATGTLQWVVHHDTEGGEGNPRLLELPDGDLLLACGHLYGVLLMRVRADDGSVVRAWSLTTGGPHSLSRVALDDGGRVLLAGQTAGRAGAPWLVGLEPDLSVAWSRVWRGELTEGSAEGVNAVLSRREGGWLVIEQGSSPRTGSQPWVMALDETGEVEWQRTYGWPGGSDFPRAVIQVPDGSYVMASQTYSVGAGFSDVWLMKLAPDGSPRWEVLHGSSGTDWPTGLDLLDDGRILVTANRQVSDVAARPWLLWLDDQGRSSSECRGSLSAAAPHEDVVSEMSEVPLTEAEVAVVLSTYHRGIESTEPPFHGWLCRGADAEVLPPGEVSRPGAETPLRVDAGSVLSWEAAELSGSSSFDLHRGLLHELPTGLSATCWDSGVVDTVVVDFSDPGAGRGWYYLVSGANSAGKGPLGTDSWGLVREEAEACP